MSELTLEQANALAAQQGMKIVQTESGFQAVPLEGVTPVATPTPQVSMPTSDECQLHKHPSGGASTTALIDSFRACGRAVNGGHEIDHNYY